MTVAAIAVLPDEPVVDPCMARAAALDAAWSPLAPRPMQTRLAGVAAPWASGAATTVIDGIDARVAAHRGALATVCGRGRAGVRGAHRVPRSRRTGDRVVGRRARDPDAPAITQAVDAVDRLHEPLLCAAEIRVRARLPKRTSTRSPRPRRASISATSPRRSRAPTGCSTRRSRGRTWCRRARSRSAGMRAWSSARRGRDSRICRLF